MLNCKDVTEHACDYLEQHLPLHKRLQMKLHLLMCYHCRRYIKQMITTIGIIKTGTTDISDEKAKKIAEKITNHQNCQH